MSLSERSPASYPDELNPATLRRFQLWRAMSDLSKAQADGRLSAEQARVLEGLADNLQQLATHLAQLADLGRQYAQALEPMLDARSSAPAADASVTDGAPPRPAAEH